MKYWLVKSEPSVYSYYDLERDGRTSWDGVRNYQARNNMRLMKIGDIAVFYHSTEGLAIVGLAKIISEHYQDPTTDDNRWQCVDVAALGRFKRQIPLAMIKADERLANIGLVRQSQLSVMPLSPIEFEAISELGGGYEIL